MGSSPKPEPLMTGLSKHRPNVPAFWPGVKVECAGCGRTGKANAWVVGRKTRAVKQCRECR